MTQFRALEYGAEVAAQDPAGLAFAAMSLHRLGQADKATSTLEQLRTLLKDERFADDSEAKALLAEAEGLIEGKRAGGGTSDR